MQSLECAGVLPLEEEQVLLRTVQLVLQVCGCHADIQVTCRKHKTLVTVLSKRVERRCGSGYTSWKYGAPGTPSDCWGTGP